MGCIAHIPEKGKIFEEVLDLCAEQLTLADFSFCTFVNTSYPVPEEQVLTQHRMSKRSSAG